MSFDISHLLNEWDYEPGQILVRRLTGEDGVDKIQLRVDLGLLQMNAAGRPDGKRPLGHESLFEHYQARLAEHRKKHGDDEGFTLAAEDCSKLQQEAIQYHHRYICLFQLEDYEAVLRDTERNLTVFNFVEEYAQTDELAWALQQFRPQLLMMQTRARGTLALKEDDYTAVAVAIQEGIEVISDFLREHSRQDLLEESGEILSLKAWLEEISQKRPLSEREKLENALAKAVEREDYEKAARFRDALRNLGAP